MTSPATAKIDQVLYGRLERLAIAAGGLLMLGIVVVSVLIAQRTSRDAQDAIRARTLRSNTVKMMDALLSAETGQRGYLLTGRAEYLAPYNEATYRLPGLMESLTRLLGNQPDMLGWRNVINDKMTELAETVRLEKAGQHAAAMSVVQSDRGRHDMDIARAISDRLGTAESNVVLADITRSEAGAQLLVMVDTVGLVVLLLLAGFVGRGFSRTVGALSSGRKELVVANDALQAGQERLEAAVLERTADLTLANEEIQRFAYIVSHDLRAPLLNIIGFTAELSHATDTLNRFVTDNLERAGLQVPTDVREASQDDLPEAIRFIQTSTAKMDRLITAILRLSREGRRVLAPERIDMAVLLGAIADSVRQLADATGAQISVGDTPPFTSDRLAVEQVFSNLIENALKYLQPGRAGRVTLTGRIEGDWVRYDVIDNGRGIASRDLERIFELFRRAGPQDTAGEGIGLAHVKALLRRLGGTIVCESIPGEGSTFVVKLPTVLAH